MKIVNKKGPFFRYTPTKSLPYVLYLCDATGTDWYDLQKEFKAHTLKIQLDETKRIVAATTDASALFPDECCLIELDDMHQPNAVGSFFINNAIVQKVEGNNKHANP